jgi:DNA mismatch repair protein MutL
MGRIVVLDQNMVNMIAAGEVIERPASVVKELMENSIDAGATEIAVLVEDGGRRLISITDNGGGMDAGDLGTAFESHATSKIKDVDDLHRISTLGFRGEALASIAAVARVRAVSRTPSSDQANCVEIDSGVKEPVIPCSGDVGTTIQVRDLFYKTPARRKFLRTANTEMGHISEQFTSIALAATGLDLTLINNGREVYRLSKTLTLTERIAKLFPMLATDGLIEVLTNERGIRIHALIGRPSLSRTSNQFQYTFLNGRFIRDKFISHAIKEAYRGLLEPNRQAVVFLFIEMPASDFDVNVHPTKTEVRFDNANLLHSQVLGALRERLLGIDLATPGKLPESPAPLGASSEPAPRAARQEIVDAMAEFFRSHRPPYQQRELELPVTSYRRTVLSEPHPVSPLPTPPSERPPEAEGPRYLQIHDSYIVEQTGEGFVVIDQHALHERMLFEKLRQRVGHNRLESQRLLLPESFEVTDAQVSVIEAHAELMTRMGIELTPFGPNSYAVQAFPVILAKTSPAAFLQDMMDLLVEKGDRLSADDLLNEVLSMAACKAAIKAGQKLTDTEIRQLLDDRRNFESTSRCPHGRPTTITFSLSELEKQFKRT